jgi:hypothetical protein
LERRRTSEGPNVGTSERPNVEEPLTERKIFGWKEATWKSVRKMEGSLEGIAIRKSLSPHPGWFLEKSSELLENKRVEFLLSAKECARV